MTITQIEKAFDEMYQNIDGPNADEQIKSFYRQKIAELVHQLDGYIEHDRNCILSQFSAGRPTKNGGYEQMFDGKWYETRPVNKTPKCDCGLNDILAGIELTEE